MICWHPFWSKFDTVPIPFALHSFSIPTLSGPETIPHSCCLCWTHFPTLQPPSNPTTPSMFSDLHFSIALETSSGAGHLTGVANTGLLERSPPKSHWKVSHPLESLPNLGRPLLLTHFNLTSCGTVAHFTSDFWQLTRTKPVESVSCVHPIGKSAVGIGHGLHAHPDSVLRQIDTAPPGQLCLTGHSPPMQSLQLLSSSLSHTPL